MLLLAGIPQAAWADTPRPLSPGGGVTLSIGLRSSITSQDTDGDGDRDTSLALDSLRLGAVVKISPTIGMTAKVDVNRDGDARLVDAFARFEPDEKFNVWAGRIVPPSDRSNLAGSYLLNTYTYPALVSRYPGRVLGRDDGVTIWGKVLSRRVVYSLGLFRGHNRIAGASNAGGHPLVAGRIAINLWEPEKSPGYYVSSTYFGAANVLTLGIAGQFEKDGAGSAVRHGDFRAWSADALMERKLPGGAAVMLEAAYYHYDTDGAGDVSRQFGGASAIGNVGGLKAGHGFLIAGGLMLPGSAGPGRLQPVVRYQQFTPAGATARASQIDACLNYVIKGQDLRLSLDFIRQEDPVAGNGDSVILGLQVRY